MKGPICLVVLDGFGLRSDREAAEHDAPALADTPFFDRADRLYPRARIETSGLAVGLPEGQMGNSEVGHMTLGAGRIFEHDTVRIQKAFDAGAPRADGTLTGLLEAGREAGISLHLFGLVSDGGVHSSLGHLEFLIDLLEEHGIAPVLHAFTDGRDTPPRSALAWIQPLEQRLLALGGCIATLSGRYWAMDRDQRWDRIALACRAIVGREGPGAASAVAAIRQGDKRILLLEGRPIGAVLRVPPPGETRANFHAGGVAQPSKLDTADRRIVERLAPKLREEGLFFVGIDVIGGYLTEINVTSPTCIREIDAQYDTDIGGQLMDCINRHLDA